MNLSPQLVANENRLDQLIAVKPIPLATLGDAAATIYTPQEDFIVRALFVASVGTTATITLHLVPSGGTAAAGNMIAGGVTVTAGAAPTLILPAQMLIETGYTLQGFASVANAVNVYGWGYDYRGGAIQP